MRVSLGLLLCGVVNDVGWLLSLNCGVDLSKLLRLGLERSSDVKVLGWQVCICAYTWEVLVTQWLVLVDGGGVVGKWLVLDTYWLVLADGGGVIGKWLILGDGVGGESLVLVTKSLGLSSAKSLVLGDGVIGESLVLVILWLVLSGGITKSLVLVIQRLVLSGGGVIGEPLVLVILWLVLSGGISKSLVLVIQRLVLSVGVCGWLVSLGWLLLLLGIGLVVVGWDRVLLGEGLWLRLLVLGLLLEGCGVVEMLGV